MATLAEVEGMAHFSAFIQISIRAMLRTWRMMRKQKKIGGGRAGAAGRITRRPCTGGETDTGATQGERTESGTGAMGKKVKKALICY
jgi:hypothetical protein